MPKLRLYREHRGESEPHDFNADRIVVGRPDIGRAVDLNMFPDRRVSRHHVELFYQDGVWWAKDMNSARGTELHRSDSTITAVSIHSPTELLPNDELILGESTLRVEYETDAVDPEGVKPIYDQIDENSAVAVDEFQPPSGVSEDQLMETMLAFTELATDMQGENLLDAYLREMKRIFGDQAQFYTILLRRDKELIPFASLPRGRTRAYFSYTLARLCIQREQAFRWPAENLETIPVTREGIVQAMYAPIIAGDMIEGVIHVGSDSLTNDFSHRDVKLLGVLARAIGPAIQRDWNARSFKPDQYPQIFLSYARENKEFVKKFAEDMRRRFVRVWYDERLEGGQSWRENLAKAIKNADALVLIMSPDSIESEYVQWELDIAQNLERRIFPVLHLESELPLSIANLQYITVGEDTNAPTYEPGLRQLVDQLKLHVQEQGWNL